MSAIREFRSGTKISRALKTYLAVLGGLWSVALLAVTVQGFLLHHDYPFNSFSLPASYRFSDFTVYDGRFAAWGQGDSFFSMPGFKFDYPAPLLLGQLAFYKFTPAPLNSYLALVLLFAIAGGILAAMAIPRDSRVQLVAAAAALCTGIFSFPLFFLLDRANIEGLVWMVCTAGLVLFAIRRYSYAALFLGLAASMKIFPAALFFLLIARKRYKEFALAVAGTAVFTLTALWLSGPSVKRAAQGIAEGLAYLRQIQIFAFKPREIGFDHSLFAIAKQVCFRILHDVERVNAILPRIYLGYGLFAAALFVVLYLRFIRRLPLLNQVLALSALSVLLPYVSYDYTLVHLYAPFAMLLLVLATDGATGRLKLSGFQTLLLLLPFAVIFTPQSYLVISVVGYGAQVKALALSILVGASIAIPMPSSLFNELHPSPALLLDLDLEPAMARLERKYV